MKDRNVQHASRFRLTKVPGTDDVYDLIPAPGEVYEEGTLINKFALLKDATAALFGLGTDAVPDDAFNLLSRFQSGFGNEYIWAKERWNWEAVKSDSTKNWTLVQTGNINRTYVRYSDDIILDNDGNISLAEPITQIYPTYNSAGSLQLDNKYVQLGRNSYAEAAASPVWFSDGVTFNGTNTYVLTYRTLESLHQRTLFGYVNSQSPDAYPPAVSDGYTYTALGQLGAKTQIATGSYVGTGTYGASNPNSLTFDFEPKFVAVFGTSDSFQLFLLNGASYAFSVRKENSNTDNYAKTSPITVSFSGNSVSWYSKNSNIYQGNYTMSHNYIAIG